MLDPYTYTKTYLIDQKATHAKQIEWLETLSQLLQQRKQLLKTASPSALTTLLHQHRCPKSIQLLLSALLRNNDLSLLPRITTTYRRLLQSEHIPVIEVTIAQSSSDVSAKLLRHFGQGAIVMTHVDPSLLGGISIQTPTSTYEYTVAGQLHQLGTALAA